MTTCANIDVNAPQTGTLTEEGLDMWGVVPSSSSAFEPAVRNPSELPLTGKMATAMATCHSLTIIEDELTGDPLDLKMFNSVNWVNVFYNRGLL